MAHYKETNSIESINLKYLDITEIILNKEKQKYKIIKQKYYIDENGNEYKVDNKYVVLKPSGREIEVAKMLGEVYGGNISIVPRVNEPQKIKTPDYIIKNEKFDLKEIKGRGKNTLYDAIGKQKRQASNFIFDITKTEINEEEAIRQIRSIYNSRHTKWVNRLFLIENDKILKVYKRG